MNDDDLIISETQWYIYLNANKLYQGYIYHRDGKISYVLPEMTVSNKPINDYGYLTEYNPMIYFDYKVFEVTEEFYNLYPLSDEDKLKITLGLTGRQLNIWGDNTIKTRGKLGGTTKGTSDASTFFRKTVLGEMKVSSRIRPYIPKRIHIPPFKPTPIRGSSWGAVVGRTVPVVGHGLVIGGVAMSGYTIYNAENKPKAIVKEAGGWVGAWAGAEVGATFGAGIGAFFGGAGAAPGTVVGAFIGGAIGFWGGSTVVEVTYEAIDN